MKTFKSILRTFNRKAAEFDATDKLLKRREEALKKAREKNLYPGYIQHIITPIAKMIVSHLGADSHEYEIMGPFGLCCESSISIFKKGSKPKSGKRFRDTLYFIQFMSDHENGAKLKTSKLVGNYPEGSIGAANGMNYKFLDIPPDAGAEWFLKRRTK